MNLGLINVGLVGCAEEISQGIPSTSKSGQPARVQCVMDYSGAEHGLAKPLCGCIRLATRTRRMMGRISLASSLHPYPGRKIQRPDILTVRYLPIKSIRAMKIHYVVEELGLVGRC